MRHKIYLQRDSATFCCSFTFIALSPNVMGEEMGGEQVHICHRFLKQLTFRRSVFVNCLLRFFSIFFASFNAEIVGQNSTL
jgi:hypothetical protein